MIPLFGDYPWEDWTIPWAGIGAAFLGLGSVLSGVAAVMTARNKKEQKNDETSGTGRSWFPYGGRKRVSGSDSTESGTIGSDEDSNG